jgi:ubiquinone/menaquinone biosynthesis C-methylase UbiE
MQTNPSEIESYHPDTAVESMRLSPIEFFAMNNPLRNFRQKYGEMPLILNLLQLHHIDLVGKVIMDMGCGSGYGTELIVKKFRPSRVIAYDLMPEQIYLARKRRLAVDFKIGDATVMEAADASCHAVFDFGILHHIPLWRKALTETARVLVPRGVLLIEEPHKLFEWDELETGLQQAGFEILERRQWYGGFFRFFLAQKIQ